MHKRLQTALNGFIKQKVKAFFFYITISQNRLNTAFHTENIPGIQFRINSWALQYS